MGLSNWLQEKLATFCGDVRVTKKELAIWPWPAVIRGLGGSRNSVLDYRFISATIKPGDMILTKQDEYAISNRAIGSSFSHLQVYTGVVSGRRDEETGEIQKPKSLGVNSDPNSGSFSPLVFKRTVTHAISEGIGTFDLLDIWSHYDYMCVVRPWKTEFEQKVIVDVALMQSGKEYDFEFDFEDSSRLACTELGAFCLKTAKIELPIFTRRATKIWKPWKKRNIIIADAFIAKYPIVAVTMSCTRLKLVDNQFRMDVHRQLLGAPDATLN